nr:T9SS type A sorting domain-containing protein [Bacteroidota bacterium]
MVLWRQCKIDFSNGTQVGKSQVVSRGSCVSICDSNSNLVFYAHTFYVPLWQQGQIDLTVVYNKSDTIMQNGVNLIGRGWYKELLILPFIDSANLFYLVQAPVTGKGGFFYSIIDMSQDSGRGAVIQKNVQLQGSTFWANDGITAIKHGNGRDWWVMVRDWNGYNNKFFYYVVTPSGLTLDHVQYIGDTVKSSAYRIEASDDGEKVACIANQGLISVFDFDRCGGWLSNEINIEYQNPNTNLIPWYWDCELSPNKRYLYVSQEFTLFDTANYLLRFDLQAANIPASRDTLYIGERTAVGGLLELAPDGKIYWACTYYPIGTFFYPYPDSTHNYITDNLSVINYPDSSFCDFQPFSFYLGGKRTYYGLPNNPNYGLGRLYGSPCDTLPWTNLTPALSKGEGVMQITYISAWEKLFINAQNLKGKNITITIYDTTGKEKFARVKPPGGGLGVFGGYFTLDVDCSGWANGLYVVHLQTEKEILSKKFVKE